MKLRNRKTGEIVEFRYLQSDHVAPLVLTTYGNDKPEMYSYNSLAELNEEWEDAPEEPKEYWFINSVGGIIRPTDTNDWTPEDADHHKEIGNYFSLREEAEKAVEKLKAWKRLKDNGFKFLNYTALGLGEITFEHNDMHKIEDIAQLEKDLDLLFGGEE